MSGGTVTASGAVTGEVLPWLPLTNVTAGEVRRAPDDSLIVATTTRVTGTVFDSIEAPFWQVASVDVSDLEAAVSDMQDTVATFDDTKQDVADKGQHGGYAGLDNTGKVPVAQLPDAALTGGSGGGGSQFVGSIDTDGELVIELTSNFGIDPADGAAYFDEDGADPADAAWPSLAADGTLNLTTFAGGFA
jgi:hypothetical protein